MKVLFVGGTGIISSACSQLALDRGLDLYLLNRGVLKPGVARGHVQAHASFTPIAAAASAPVN